VSIAIEGCERLLHGKPCWRQVCAWCWGVLHFDQHVRSAEVRDHGHSTKNVRAHYLTSLVCYMHVALSSTSHLVETFDAHYRCLCEAAVSVRKKRKKLKPKIHVT